MKESKLENEPKIESGFKTPDHYFENFSSKIILQLPQEEPKVISIFQKKKSCAYDGSSCFNLGFNGPNLPDFYCKRC